MFLKAEDRKTIKDLAAKIRNEYNLTSLPIDIAKILNDKNIKFFTANLDNINGYELSGLIEKKDNGEIRIIVNNQHQDTRNVFTVAHELGHYFLGDLNGKKRVVSLRGGSKNKKERAADFFAAELLMPEDLIRETIEKLFFPTLQEMANKFRVSRAAMKYRLDFLGVPYYG
ncbi:ImmA/IrrE family metallo-endopeptidase [uncultured Ilyobacter sp.]|uniref:ImmA/IrrE family metallo-endopeptidase n=1 Tax=uncultured Ilyobacter sp. TaxID=544433 RepID=UPI0029C79578|nr:ImmA/IrrE family metallo-endopeptidase [uncultured Ilyobacter sp.]